MSSGIQRKLHSGIDLRQKKDKLISELHSSIFSASLLLVYMTNLASCLHYSSIFLIIDHVNIILNKQIYCLIVKDKYRFATFIVLLIMPSCTKICARIHAWRKTVL